MERTGAEIATSEDATQRFLDHYKISQTEVAGWLEVQPAAISRKLKGSRRWNDDEIKTFLTRASERLGRPVFFEEAFVVGPSTQAAEN